MFGSGRRERRIRERGRPARAVILSAAPAAAGWRLRVRVEPGPGEGEPFEAAVAVGDHPLPEGPPVGAELDVLHHGGRVVAAGPLPATAPQPEAEPEGHAAPAADASGPVDMVTQVLRRMADGSLVSGQPEIVLDDEGGRTVLPAPTRVSADLADRSVEELVALAENDPDAVGDEVLRRITTGQTTFNRLVDDALATGPDGGAAVHAVLAALHRRGMIGKRQFAMLTRMVG